MPTLQAILVILLSIAFTVYILYTARSTRLDMRYAITWLIVAAGAIFIAIFPNLIMRISYLLQFEAATNMLFIAAIVVLAVIVFRLTITLSKMEKRILQLTQALALLNDTQKEDFTNDDNEENAE
ncbi:MAG: DUF2304 domain-containing protein [Defluviitaleaceae bacterium]|nr:DUF2304 domain-containing protein [Defluviitaleaceae bacterium]MCL2273780.1 DUF2304 domain-containing protein [Defluviitaleaceae bacterium]